MYFRLRFYRKFSDLAQSHALPFLVNSRIKALVQQGQYVEALQLYSTNPHCPHIVTAFTFPSLIKTCALLSNLRYGKTLHSTIITMGFELDTYVTTSLIDMYVKCGSLGCAVKVFDKLTVSQVLAQDVTVWNSIIDGYFRYGHFRTGFDQFYRMQWMGVRPDGYSVCILLGVCEKLLECMAGEQIHGYIVRNMFGDDPFLDTALMGMYSSCGRPMDAWHVFSKLKDKSNVVTWNVMIGGFCESGMWGCCWELYSRMKNENVKFGSASFSSTLSSCCQGDNVGFGRRVHCDLIKMGFQKDPYVQTSLLTMYAKCKLVGDAEEVFYQMANKGIESWNAMIAAYVGNGCAYDALDIYKEMRLNGIPPDSSTVLNILSFSSMIRLHDFGSSVHAELIKRSMQSDIAVQSALLTMYCKCERNDEAKTVFGGMRKRDVVAWGSIVSGLCQNRKFEEALYFFRAMETDGMEPDSDILASVISACAGMEDIGLGCRIHGFVVKCGLELDVFIASSLIDMYSKFGFPEMVGSIFYSMPRKNLVAWNSIISCYCRNGLPELSISLFPQILQNKLYPDSISVSCVLAAISSIAALLKGKIIHGYLIRIKIPSDIEVENALIDMYIKCGSLKYAQYIFQNMPQKNLMTWNSMIAGYGSHGNCLQAMKSFDEMKSSGITPDEVTFLSLISSCSHCGLVEDGLNLFQSMRREYGVEPRMEHYVNVVDLLGRAGRLDDAYNFVKNMPIEPDRSVWLCLLCASRACGNIELGELAAHNLLKMEPSRGSNYVQLLNLYGEAELWDKAASLRASMKEKGLKKSPACSWIELRNRVDVFFSGDSSSTKTIEIYETLRSLRSNMGKKGSNWQSVEAH